MWHHSGYWGFSLCTGGAERCCLTERKGGAAGGPLLGSGCVNGMTGNPPPSTQSQQNEHTNTHGSTDGAGVDQWQSAAKICRTVCTTYKPLWYYIDMAKKLLTSKLGVSRDETWPEFRLMRFTSFNGNIRKSQLHFVEILDNTGFYLGKNCHGNVCEQQLEVQPLMWSVCISTSCRNIHAWIGAATRGVFVVRGVFSVSHTEGRSRGSELLTHDH